MTAEQFKLTCEISSLSFSLNSSQIIE